MSECRHDRDNPVWCVEHSWKPPKYEDKHFTECEAVTAALRTALAQAVEALPDPEKLNLLADWFDVDDEKKGGNRGGQVQAELREWARRIVTAVAAAQGVGVK